MMYITRCMIKKFISITEARKKLFKLAEAVQMPDTHYILTIDGKPEVVLMSFEEFESLWETIDELSDPDSLEALRKAEEEFARGDYVTLEEMQEELELEKRGAMVLAEQPKKKYQVRQRKT